MSLGYILLVVLLLMVVGAIPRWPHRGFLLILSSSVPKYCRWDALPMGS